MSRRRSLVEDLGVLVSAQPGQRLFLFIDDAGVESTLTYEELDRASRVVARRLLVKGQPGDRVLLAFDSGAEFVIGLWGVLYAGMTAVPLDPPSQDRTTDLFARFQNIAVNSAAAQGLAARSTIEFINQQLAAAGVRQELHWERLDAAEVLARAPSPDTGAALPEPDGTRIAALLYTSGSTGSPKGTMLGDANTAELIRRRVAFQREKAVADGIATADVTICWLPLTHATGFLECLIACMWPELLGVLMAPQSFTRSPKSWLAAISAQSKAGLRVHSIAPNFALDWCVASIPEGERRDLDLRGWTHFASVGERVRPESWRAFNDAFRDSGFDPPVFFTVYGSSETGAMATAENPRTVSFPRQSIDEGILVSAPEGPGTVQLLTAGAAFPMVGLLIVDPETNVPLPENRIGEIWAKRVVSQGYWRLPEASERVFGARTKDGDGPYFRTGDLGGFFEGELFVTGRLKAVIIIRGQKHHSEDIEATLERRLDWIPASSTIAFSDDVGAELFYLAVETPVDGADIQTKGAAIRAVVAEDFGIRVTEVLFVARGSLPRTNTGKLMRAACRDQFRAGQLPLVARYGASTATVQTRLQTSCDEVMAETDTTVRTARMIACVQSLLASVLVIDVAELDPSTTFHAMGLDSAGGVRFLNDLSRWIARPLPATLLYNFPTLGAVAAYLCDESAGSSPVDSDDPNDAAPKHASDASSPIAIVGVGCRFPGGATSAESLWSNLAAGVDAIGSPPPERSAYYSAADMRDTQGGFLRDIEQFDRAYFSISKREAESMDPLQRVLLEVTIEALENGGVTTERIRGGSTGVFVGIAGGSGYDRLRQGADLDPYSSTATQASVVSGRISYLLDVRGPTVTVDAACASSLVAIHLACQSLKAGETSIAIAGGVTLMASLVGNRAMRAAGALSADARCKTFDAAANGYVRSEGCGVLVLKRLSDAIAAGDRILGVIVGSATGSDGRSNGLTAPNGLAQYEVIRAALAAGGIRPDDIEYVEAHGTGTPLGDPIELEALGRVFRSANRPKTPLVVGSVKANIGHTEAAAGVAGVIKLLGMFRNEAIPRQVHFFEPTSAVSWSSLALEVPRVRRAWRSAGKPRLAGVSSFGFSGTLAHAVLAEPPEVAPEAARASQELAARGEPLVLPLSAKSAEGLKAYAEAFAELLGGEQLDGNYRDVAFTASVRRDHHAHRLTVVGASREEWRDKLRAFVAGEGRPGLRAGAVPEGRPRSVFVFSGQGPQWWGIGRRLLATEPVFREAVEECDTWIRKAGGPAILEELQRSEADSRLGNTAIAQPALFAIQVALVALWRSWSVEPDAVIGHSVGEIAAAHAVGALSLGDAAHLVTHRGRIMQKATGLGKMASVGLPLEEARRVIEAYGERLSIGASNGPTSTVLSGQTKALEQVVETLLARKIEVKWLAVDYAFHSAQMEGCGDELRRELTGLVAHEASRPIVSSVSGLPRAGTSFDAAYWGNQIQQPVLFMKGIEELLRKSYGLFIEIGPHPVLSSAIRETAAAAERTVTIVPSLRRGKEDERTSMLDSLGALHCHGYPVDWTTQYPVPARVISLPLYAWQRARYWLEPTAASDQRRRVRIEGVEHEAHPFLVNHVQLAEPTRHVWETSVDTKTFAYLADHQVQGLVLFPGAAFAEIALAAGKELFGEGLDRLSDLEILQPLILREEGSTIVQCLVTMPRANGAACALEISSHTAGSSSSVIHAKGTIYATAGNDQDDAAPVRISAEEVIARCTESRTGKAIYEAMARAGNQFGPRFRNLHQVWRRDGEAIAKLALDTEVKDRSGDYCIHPALLDAAFQALKGAVPASADGAGGAHVVTGFDSLQVTGDASASAWIHALAAPAPTGDRATAAGIVAGDVSLLDDAGNVLVEVRGLRLQPLANRTTDSLDETLFELAWRPKPKAEPGDKNAVTGALVLGDGVGLAARVKATLDARGVKSGAVRRGKVYAQHGPADFELDPTKPEHFARLLREPAVAELLADGCVVDLWSLDASSRDLAAIHEGFRDGTVASLHLVQALAATGTRTSPRLVLTTRGAQAIGREQVSVAQSPVWGFGSTVARELPELRCTMVDLDPDSDDASLLVAEITSADAETRVAFRRGERFAQRLIRRPETVALDQQPKTPLVVGDQGYRLELGAPGLVDSLTLVQADRVPPAANQVEISVRATGLNFRDVLMAIGAYPSTAAARLPLGGECSGVVVAVGSEVRGTRIGDEVIASGVNAFDRYLTVSERYVAPKPRALGFEDAAGISAVFSTVYYSLHEVGRLRKGESILIHSAAGGVGLAAIQYARHVGAEIFATAGTEEKRELLRSMGLRHVMDSRSLAWADEVMKLTGGRGVDVVLNSLAGEAIAKGIEALAPFGRFLELGKRDVYSNTQVGLYAFRNNVTVAVIAVDQLAAAQPDAHRALIERVLELFEEGVFTPLPRATFPISRVADAFRHMMPGKHVGKVIVTAEDTVSVAALAAGDRVRSDATYLVTGGLSGLGLTVVEWLVKRGAKHLALLGRRPPAGDTTTRLAELRERGVEIDVQAVDVADERQLASVFERVERTMPAIRGVVHSAGVIDDATIPNLDAARFLGAVAKAKIDGGWNLHELTRNRQLDFFVLFSSIASPLGSPGQANYASANAFLDALAHYRRSMGLPATTIDWGPWSDTGMATKGAAAARGLDAIGLSSADGLQILELVLRSSGAQVLAVAPPLARILARTEGALFDELRKAERSSSTDTALREELAARTEGERDVAIEAILRAVVARILREDPAAIDVSASFTEIGMDSLMSVELRSRIRKQLDLDIAPVDILKYPTVSALARFASAELFGHAPHAPRAGEGHHDARGQGARSAGRSGDGVLKTLKDAGEAPRLRIVCFPYAGGDPDDYRDWVRLIPEHVELCAVSYDRAGAEGVDAGRLSLEQLARKIVEAIAARPSAPVALFGHSIGAGVAHTVALALERRGIAVAYAGLSAPPLTATAHPPRRLDLSSPGGREAVLEFMRSIDVNTDLLVEDNELSRVFLERFVAQLDWAHDFSTSVKLRCPVGVFYAQHDKSSTSENLAGWQKCGDTVDMHAFSGNHFFFREHYPSILSSLLTKSAAGDPTAARRAVVID